MTIRCHHALLRSAATGVAVLGFALLPLTGQAQRRDFAGTYQLTHVAQTADETSLTMTLTLRNYSNSDIYDAGVVLYDSSSNPFPTPSSKGSGAGNPLAAFNLIKLLPSSHDVTLSRRFTIPTHEYLRWEQGAQPRLMFLKPEGGGTEIVPIDLHRVFGPPLGTQQNTTEVAR